MTRIPTAITVPTTTCRGSISVTASLLKVLQIKEREGLWVIRNRFMPATRLQTHKHTGPV